MIVTDKEYFMEKRLVQKLDLMIKRINGKDDAIVLIAGDEGVGKSNMASGICYYVSNQTGREYSPTNNIFFDLDKLIEFGSKTEAKIIHWDEGALGGLASEWWRKNQQKFLKLLMVARKKRHFMVICVPKFYKLNEYIVVERSLGLIHCYARNNLEKGRFFYYTKLKKEYLYDDWKRSRKRNYKKYKSFAGSFLEYMPKIFTKEQLQEYEDKKDQAILSIRDDGKKELTKKEKSFIVYKYKLWKAIKDKKIDISMQRMADCLDIARSTFSEWGDYIDKHPFLKEVC